MTETEYKDRELKKHFEWLESRRLLGKDWKIDAEGLEPQTSINRINWLFNGSYGAGAMFHAKQIIEHQKPLAAARAIVVLITMLDTTELNARKITQLWKAAGVNFTAINAAAAAEIKRYQETNE